jgi:hypothetical protein
LLAFLIIMALPGEPLVAALQQESDVYAKKIKEAENKYLNGDFDSSIRILEESLRSLNFPTDLKMPAYELLAQNYLAKSLVTKAESAIRQLLQLVPAYVPSPENPPFAAEVEKVRQEMASKAPVEPVKQKEEVAWYENTWVLVGGGVLVAGGVALLLLTGDDGNGTVIPPPPKLADPPVLP